MTALSGPRNTRKAGGGTRVAQLTIPVKGGVKIWQGALVMVDAGYARGGAVAVGKFVAGRAAETVDNTAGADGAKTIRVERGCFKWSNATAGDLITQADLLATCYILDDQTVAKTSNGNTRSVAGTIIQVDADGVWVE